MNDELSTKDSAEQDQVQTVAEPIQKETGNPLFIVSVGAVFLVLLLLLLTLSGVFHKTPELPAIGPIVDESIPEPERTPLTLPADWPETVPVMTDAAESTLESAFGEPGTTVTYETRNDPEAVIVWYENYLETKGGSVVMRSNLPEHTLMIARIPANPDFIIYISATAWGSKVTLNSAPETVQTEVSSETSGQ